MMFFYTFSQNKDSQKYKIHSLKRNGKTFLFKNEEKNSKKEYKKSLRYISVSKARRKTAATYSPTNAVPSA